MEAMIERALEVQQKITGFTLAGGTSIMFKYQHRASIDLDFFKEKSFSFNRLEDKMNKTFDVQRTERLEDNIDFVVKNTKISFVFFPFSPIMPRQRVKGVKMYSDYDLLLNKIYAAGRRVDEKDPYDVAALLIRNSWNNEDIKRDFERKFPHQSYAIYLGALLSFEDYPGLENWVKDELVKLKN